MAYLIGICFVSVFFSGFMAGVFCERWRSEDIDGYKNTLEKVEGLK